MPLAWDKQYFNVLDIYSMASQNKEMDAVPLEKEELMETTWKFFSLSQECATQKLIERCDSS